MNKFIIIKGHIDGDNPESYFRRNDNGDIFFNKNDIKKYIIDNTKFQIRFIDSLILDLKNNGKIVSVISWEYIIIFNEVGKEKMKSFIRPSMRKNIKEYIEVELREYNLNNILCG